MCATATRATGLATRSSFGLHAVGLGIATTHPGLGNNAVSDVVTENGLDIGLVLNLSLVLRWPFYSVCICHFVCLSLPDGSLLSHSPSMTLPKHFTGPQTEPEGPTRTDSHCMTVDHNSTQPTVLTSRSARQVMAKTWLPANPPACEKLNLGQLGGFPPSTSYM